MECLHGGISFFNINSTNKTHITTICSSTLRRILHLQNIYSNSYELLMVCYSYRVYSSLEAILNISYTMCKPVQINVCALNSACVLTQELDVCKLSPEKLRRRCSNMNTYTNFFDNQKTNITIKRQHSLDYIKTTANTAELPNHHIMPSYQSK